jgi:RNA polymerase sigma-70 factor (ECF subfamily)
MTHRGSRGEEPRGWDWGWVRATCWEEARRVLGPGAAADDAAQEAAIKAWRHHASCRTPEQPRPWLAAIARREAFRLRGPPSAESLETAAEPYVPAADARVALAVDVRRALAELSDGDRRLLLARYWADLTQHEAANLLGMPDGTAKVRLHRLRARLRPTLREQ